MNATNPERKTLPDDCIDERTRRALERALTVTPNLGRAKGAEDLVLVTSGNSGRSHLVDLRAETCECEDSQYRNPEGGCYHVRRAKIATGRRPVSTAELAAADVDPQLGQHTDGPRVVTSDGGIIEAGDDGEILDDGPTYTYHTEPAEQGGTKYVRCETCGAECIPADPDRLVHCADCPHAEVCP